MARCALGSRGLPSLDFGTKARFANASASKFIVTGKNHNFPTFLLLFFDVLSLEASRERSVGL
jgi:hypothetical protein